MMVPWEGSEWPPRTWQREALPIIIDGLRRKEAGMVCAVMGAGKSILQAEVIRMALHRLGDRAIVVCVPSQRLVRQLAATVAGRIGADAVGVFYGRKKQPMRQVIITCNPSLPALVDAFDGRRVGLVLIDEAHRAEAAVVRDTVPQLNAWGVVGFTATPFRSIPAETISLFSSLWYRYDITDAVRDGVLVPPHVVRWSGPENTDVDDACIEMIVGHADGPGIVSAVDITDAELYAARLTAAGIPSLAIHSRLTRTEQDARLERLRSGDIRCLVHVSLLAEGVDFPWLRWLCLRREVQARVRFLQEVGRVLRVHPGKAMGVILDPHLLLGRHGWVTAEAIGKALEQAAEAEARDGSADASSPMRPTPSEAVALDRLLVYLGRAVRDLRFAGICANGLKANDDGWRIAPVTLAQVDAIKSASRLTRHIPMRRREPFRALVKVPWALTRGQAGDLLDVLFGGARWARAEAARLASSEPWRIQWDAGNVRPARMPDVESSTAVTRWGARVARAQKKAQKDAP